MYIADSSLSLGHREVAKRVSKSIEAGAVAAIVAFLAGIRSIRAYGSAGVIKRSNQYPGRGLLLGLDLLIAAEVVRTVTLDPTLVNVPALGVLVVVRTFLAWSLTVELEGPWPWLLTDRSEG